MKGKIIQFWHWLRNKFRRSEVPYLGTVGDFTEPITDGSLALAFSPSRSPRAQRQPSVEWHFRSTILDRLDEYFVCMRRLRRVDPVSYGLFARMGFAVAADAYRNPDTNKDRLRAVKRLSFGGILCGGFGDTEGAQCQPSFIYFKKVASPQSVQRSSGAIYRLTALYDDRRAERHWGIRLSAALVCHVSLNDDGSIHVLKELVSSRSEFTRKRRNGQKERVGFRTSTWSLPAWMSTVESPEDWARHLFGLALLTYADVVDGIIVRATQQRCVAAFSIDLPRAKRFFIDRAVDLASDGRRKRIFHSVVEHERQLSAERIVTVRQHYRGQRSFDWKSYRIHIVLPKNSSIMHFDKAAPYLEDVPKVDRPKMIGEEEVGEILAEALAR